MRNLVISLGVIAIVDIVWLNMSHATFTEWGWLAVAVGGFVLPFALPRN